MTKADKCRAAILEDRALAKIRVRHPWFFRGDFTHLPLEEENGSLVPLASKSREVLAWGFLSAGSSLCVRAFSWGPKRPDTVKLLEMRLREALEVRNRFLEPGEDAYRWVHGEADGLPGLVVDRYGPVVVLQTLCAGMFGLRGEVAGLLSRLGGARAVVMRNDGRYLEGEGIPRQREILLGDLRAGERFPVKTGDIRSLVDCFAGQKTGLYLDVRKYPRVTRPFCEGARVLDAFSYCGNFTLHAILYGAREVLALDQSGEALENLEGNLRLNSLQGKAELAPEQCNVFDRLRQLEQEGKPFDLVVMDPPPFAPSKRQAEGARRGYKELAVRGFRMLSPGGAMLFFSCSQAFGRDALMETLAAAARDARRTSRVLAELHQPPDHPVSLDFPEGDYLKGFLVEARP